MARATIGMLPTMAPNTASPVTRCPTDKFAPVVSGLGSMTSSRALVAAPPAANLTASSAGLHSFPVTRAALSAFSATPNPVMVNAHSSGLIKDAAILPVTLGYAAFTLRRRIVSSASAFI